MPTIFQKVIFFASRHITNRYFKTKLISAEYEFTSDNARNYLQNNKNEEIFTFLQNFKDFAIIDVGCGNGNYTSAFKPNKYIGLDISSELISIAKKRHPKYSFQTLDILKSDINFHCDYVIFCSVLEHLPSFRLVVNMIDESLRISNFGLIAIWHSPPRKSQLWSTTKLVPGHFGKLIFQNYYPRWFFALKFNFKIINTNQHQIWVFKK